MSDTATPAAPWTPSSDFGDALASIDPNQSTAYYQSVANRVKLIANTSPYLAANPDALQALATDPNISNVDLATQTAQMSGQVSADSMAKSIAGMEPSAQRLVWSNMTGTQRAALKQLGYGGPPSADGPSALASALGGVGGVLSTVIGGPGHELVHAGGELLHGLQIVSDQPAHLYRAIRTMDSSSQEVALGAGLIAALGIAAAPFTAGLSLGATAAAVGLGGLAAASGAAALTNPTDWWDAMKNTYDGERVFTRDAQKQARTILGNDATLNNLAKDIAFDGDLYDLASDFASTRDATAKNTMLHSIDKVASKIVDKTDPRYQSVTAGLANLVSDPNFMKAVNTLQMGKISFGRDIARGVGLSPGSGLYSVVSGSLDGLWVISLDPTLALGQVAEWNKVRRFGVPIAEDLAPTISRISSLFEKSGATGESVRRYYDILADGVERSDPQHIKEFLPDAQKMVPDLLDYRNELRAAGKDTPFTRDDILGWYKRGDGIQAMTAGRGTVKGEAEILMPHMGVGSYAWAKAKNYTKAVIDFADADAARAISRRLDEDIRPLEGELNPETFVNNAAGPTPAYSVGQNVQLAADRYSRTKAIVSILDHIPGAKSVGALLGSATTMVPEREFISLTGPNAALDVDKFVDLGRTVGMVRDDRAMWKGFILDQQNPALRIMAAKSFLDSMLTSGGLRSLPEGVSLSDQFLLKWHQTYALGGLDEYAIGGIQQKVGILPVADQAVQLVIPDLKVLRQALSKQTITKYLLNAADAHYIDTAMNRVWKPLVLLRLGFIPRAAGEELLAFMARVGPSHILQEMAHNSIAQGAVAGMDRDALLKLRGGVPLTGMEARQIERWQTVAHMRPLERMFARGDYEQPIHSVLSNYSTWLRSTLEDGLLPNSGAAVPDRLKTAVLGTPRSLRRFLLTGADTEMKEAALEFQAKAGDTLFRAVSNSNAGLLDRGVRKNLIPIEVADSADPSKTVTQMYVESRGRFVSYDRGDVQYNRALHEQLQRTTSDPIVGHVYGDLLTRHEPQFADLSTDGAIQFANHYADVVGHQRAGINALVRETLDGQPLSTLERDNLLKTLRTSGDFNDRQIKELDSILPDGEITTNELWTSVRQVVEKSNKTARVKAISAVLPDAEAMMNRIAELGPDSRGWLAPFLEHGSWTKESLAAGDYFHDAASIDARADEALAGEMLKPGGQSAIKQSQRGGLTPQGAVVRNPVPDSMARVYNPALSPSSTRKLQETLGALVQPGVDPLVSAHASVDALMSQWATTTKSIGTDLSGYDKVAENFFSTLVQKQGRLGDLADMTERMDKTGIVPLSIYAVDDPRVAQALSATLRDFVGSTAETGLNRAVSYMDVRRDVAAMRLHGADGVSQPFRDAGATGWQVDPDLLHARAEIVPETAQYENMNGQWTFGTSAEDATQEWAKGIRERVNQVTRSGTERSFFARGERPIYRETKDATKIEVGAGEVLSKGRRYIDGDGKLVRWGDSRFMDSSVSQVEDSPFMWEIVGPAMRDAMDEARGAMQYTADGKRIYRSKVDQIANSRAIDLPDGALGVMTTPYKQGSWDRFVSWGFDKVISPAIDAIVRKPMAFHEFTNAWIEANKLTRPLLIDSALIDERIVNHFLGVAPAAFSTDAERAAILGDARSVGHLFDDPINHLSDDELLKTLHGMGSDGLGHVARRADTRVGWDQGTSADYDAAMRLVNQPDGTFKYLRSDVDRNLEFTKDLLAKAGKSINAPWQIAKAHPAIGSLERGTKAERALFRGLDEGGWDLLQQAKTNIDHARKTVSDLAIDRAITNTIPFLDSHEIRSQMSEYGKQFAPFWYAEENFMKRWANTLKIAPESLRKGQLTYMGLKSVGVIRTDQAGKDWFVYPGSGALAEALGHVPGLSVLPIGAMFQAEPKNMLPGFNRLGTPSASPLITFPLDVATSFFSELRPLQTALAGGQGVNTGIARHLIPTQLYNVWEATFGNEHSSARYASAMMSAAAYMEAHGQGLPEGANADQMSDYMESLRNHAHTVLIAQALVGFVAPGSPQQIVTGDTGGLGSSLTGVGVTDPDQILRDEYLTLVRTQGIEEGTGTFMARHPKGDLEDLVNPLAVTVGTTESTAGAALPATRQAVAWYDEHADYLHQFPNAAGYLLPPDKDSTDAADLNAYGEQTLNGLRKRRTPDEFLRAIRFKEGSFDYYASKGDYDKALSAADQAGNKTAKAAITAQWQQWSTIYKAQHPVFADELESSDGRTRRTDTLQELRQALRDPQAPQAWHTAALKTLVDDYDTYRGALSELADDRTSRAQATSDQIKAAWQEWMVRQAALHPELSPFITAVLKPETAS